MLSAALVAWASIARAHEPLATSLLAAHRACDRTHLESLVRASSPEGLAVTLARGARAERLAVLRGAAGVAEPHSMLSALARVMADDDEELALAAAQSLTRMVPGLAAAPRGADDAAAQRDDLAPALRVADDVRARADLRAASRFLRSFVPPTGARR